MIWKPSPNFTAGRGGKKIEFIVCHWIVGKLAAADAVFSKAANQASAHYAVGANEIHQYVKEEDTAWHAGATAANGGFSVNQRSIGIEHEGGPNLPITDAVYSRSAGLIADIWRRHGKLPLRKHNEFKPTQCPGTLDLGRLEREANAILNPPPPADPCAAKDEEIRKLKADKLAINAELNATAAKLAACENRPPQIIEKEVIKEVPVEKIVEVEKIIKVPAEELTTWQHVANALRIFFGLNKEK